jgi:hypothetical protein
LRRSVARPRGLWSVAPATGAAATTELPPLLPRCRPAATAGAARCPPLPGCHVRDGVRRSPRVVTDQPDQPDQHPTNPRRLGTVTKSSYTNGFAPTRPNRPNPPYCFSLLHAYTPSLRTYALNKGMLVGWSGRVLSPRADNELVTDQHPTNTRPTPDQPDQPETLWSGRPPLFRGTAKTWGTRPGGYWSVHPRGTVPPRNRMPR